MDFPLFEWRRATGRPFSDPTFLFYRKSALGYLETPMPQAPLWRRLAGVVLALLIASWLTSFAAEDSGRALALQYCSACHVFPEPNLLDKRTWRDQTLRRMKIRMGLAPEEFERHPEAELLKKAGIYLTTPMLSLEDWNAITNYYVQTAPEAALPQDPRPEIQVGMKHFAAERPKYRRPSPSTTLVKASPQTGRIYMGDANTKSLDILALDTTFLQNISVQNIPISVTETSNGFYLTSIGHFQPSERTDAEVRFISGGASKTILTHLLRVTCAEFADLDRNGKTDIILCIYGNNAGRFSWFENFGNDRYEERELIPKSGAIRTEARDFNGDGFLDLAVLQAQETESLHIFLNDGKGNFTARTIFHKPPIMGHTYFETADFNKDGKLDFIVTNGDNGEYPSPMKKYHGIRIYLQRGDLGFKEAYFFPMNGAFKAMARDFDLDGDLDIAAISFFPDYQKSPEESFVYLENQGGLQFTASTFPECIMGRWLTMDVADLEGDGDIDIILGSHIQGPSPVPAEYMQNWQTIGPSVLTLRNSIRPAK